MEKSIAAKHCCERMEYDLNQKCDHHPIRTDCPDMLIYLNNKNNEYGLIIHDGGSSYIKINYCPWCGASLNLSK